MGVKLIPGIEYAIESAMFHKMLILKQKSTVLKFQFLHMDSMSPRINSATELIFHRDSITWNRIHGSDAWDPYKLIKIRILE
jgi:hypothetical protein